MNLTTITKTEQKMIETVLSSKVSTAYSNTELHTVEDCKDQYLKADEIASIAKNAIKDKLQGFALLKAKKIICDDEWDAAQLTHKTSKKWKDFLHVLNLIGKDGAVSKNVLYLLDFAGYKESGGKIETASHYREVKKVSSTKTHTEIDAMYDEAGGEALVTAKEVKKGVQKQKVWVQPLFEKEVGKEPRITLSSVAYGMEINNTMPTPTPEEWKSFYRTVASCVHPDKGGNSEHTAILTQLNKMYQLVFTHEKEVSKKNEWNADYKMWKEDKGYKDEFIKEEEL